MTLNLKRILKALVWAAGVFLAFIFLIAIVCLLAVFLSKIIPAGLIFLVFGLAVIISYITFVVTYEGAE